MEPRKTSTIPTCSHPNKISSCTISPATSAELRWFGFTCTIILGPALSSDASLGFTKWFHDSSLTPFWPDGSFCFSFKLGLPSKIIEVGWRLILRNALSVLQVSTYTCHRKFQGAKKRNSDAQNFSTKNKYWKRNKKLKS